MKLVTPGLTFIATLVLATAIFAEDNADSFQPGDLIFRGATDLRWYRGDKQLGNWGPTLPIAGDAQHQLWTGQVQEGKIVLKKFTAPTKSQDYSSDAKFEGATVAKVIPSGDQIYVLVTMPHNGKESERVVKVVPFSVSGGTFGDEIILKDDSGAPELLILPPIPAPDQLPKPRRDLLTHGIWDAVLFGNNQLWISSQDQILAYLVSAAPAGTNGTAHVEGNGARKKVIHRRDTDVGNPRGIAAYSDTQLAMVDCSGSGRVILLGALGPVSSAPLTAAIDPDVTFTWGWSGIAVSKDDIFVSNNNPAAARVTRIDRKSGQVKGNVVTGFPVTEIVEIQ